MTLLLEATCSPSAPSYRETQVLSNDTCHVQDLQCENCSSPWLCPSPGLLMWISFPTLMGCKLSAVNTQITGITRYKSLCENKTYHDAYHEPGIKLYFKFEQDIIEQSRGCLLPLWFLYTNEISFIF